MHKTTLYLPDELRCSLKEAARTAGKPEAELVREALRSYLHAEERPRPTFIGIGEDSELSAVDAKRWVREQWLKGR